MNKAIITDRSANPTLANLSSVQTSLLTSCICRVARDQNWRKYRLLVLLMKK